MNASRSPSSVPGILAPVEARRQHVTVTQELEPPGAIGLNETEQGPARGGQPRQKVLDRDVAIRSDERRGSGGGIRRERAG